MYQRLLLVIVALALLEACSSAPRNSSAPTLSIEVAAAKSRTISPRKTYIGNISAAYSSVIQPRVNGYLAESLFENGMPVSKGQIIFRLDGREQRAQMLAARAELAAAEANAVEARNNYERAIPLAKINAISQAQLDQRTAEYEAAKSSVESARQNLVNARLEVEYTEIQSPIDGIIASSAAHVGDYVGPGTQFSALTTIQNIDTVSVDIAVPMRQYLQYSGRKSFTYDNDGLLSDVKLYLADGELYPYNGWYNFTRPDVSDAMGTIIIVVSFPNPDYLLKAGQFARVKTGLGNGVECVMVPQQAITERQNVGSLWVVDAENKVHFREVTLGDTYGEWRIVTSGLQAGEVVAVDGIMKLHDGVKITPVKSEAYE